MMEETKGFEEEKELTLKHLRELLKLIKLMRFGTTFDSLSNHLDFYGESHDCI